MTPGKLKQLEEKLQARAVELDTRETNLNGKATALSGKAVPTTPPPTTPIPSSTYVGNMKTLVPITLDLHDSNYTKWRELFITALGRYGLTSHVLATKDSGTSDTSATSDWAYDDYTVLTWIYGSITMKHFGIIMAPGSIARQV
jgi:hypothetical protein